MTNYEIKANIKNLQAYETLNLYKGLIYTTSGLTMISLANSSLTSDTGMAGLTLAVAGIAVASSSIETEQKITALEKQLTKKPRRLVKRK